MILRNSNDLTLIFSKSNLNLAITKIITLQKKCAEDFESKRKYVSTFITKNQTDLIKKDVEYIIKEQNNKKALEILLNHLENLIVHLETVKKSWNCPNEVLSSVSTVIYASTRVKSMELIELRRLLTVKFGQKFALGANTNSSGNVDQKFIQFYDTSSFTSNSILDILTDIAKQYKIKFGTYDPTNEIEKEKEVIQVESFEDKFKSFRDLKTKPEEKSLNESKKLLQIERIEKAKSEEIKHIKEELEEKLSP